MNIPSGMVLFGWRCTAGNIPNLEALLVQVLLLLRAATMASVMRFPSEHSEWLHMSLSAVKFLVFTVRDSFWLCSLVSSVLIRSKAALFSERFNHFASVNFRAQFHGTYIHFQNGSQICNEWIIWWHSRLLTEQNVATLMFYAHIQKVPGSILNQITTYLKRGFSWFYVISWGNNSSLMVNILSHMTLNSVVKTLSLNNVIINKR